MKSLLAEHSKLAIAGEQIAILEHGQSGHFNLIPFQQKLEAAGLYPLQPTSLEVFQVNVGKMCNQVCRHCHVDAGPDRKEIMSKETMQLCLDALKNNPSLTTVDITGGAPEMNPHFRWFVEAIKKLERHIIVRCNLTIILANKKYNDLPEFYKEHQVEVVSSLPFYTQDRTDRQRGNGVFDDSIKALQMLNAIGYGLEETGLILNLVYNPAGAFLPPSQLALEKEYKTALSKQYGIAFNNLFAITNLPISRFLDYLLQSGNYEKYMEKLLIAYNPFAAANVMCRNTISVGWDGYLYDCDFNQMLDLKMAGSHNHIAHFNTEKLYNRNIIVGQHCYGCTAGAGSSCGGAVA
ncbi:arsenosugar biosynthesis radical SAM protein ArsS [Ferruginibacter paludis]|uniref:arsenosugar biosynthesis radical SAM (seleno)protein ArsS n=1 Tax=Ferruginibacter paludis TaxID=1310417 RepID=UPI0025B305AD|nr:arsenosugar biosynthesis radical SAM (seleno)protein ArsS [Ferruginibacter paludis]MDN3656673.1 arsenosugar biosynthesis radical SAM protein ArsS [Ferruginibacter paludis]